MLLDALNAARDIGRLHDIASVLIRHGLGESVRRLGIAPLLERAGRALHWKGAEGLGRAPEVRVREAMEDLGPTFVKVGQILAGRSDLLPPTWTAELSKLHERASAVPFDQIRTQLVEDLGADPSELFDDFDPEPIACASIAQVYRATLRPESPGESPVPVVLKVRRPGIDEVVEADLRLLERLAETAEERLPELARYRPRQLVRQLARSLHNELDLRVEARNAQRLLANLPEDSALVLPRVHAPWVHERVYVMDFLEGQSIGAWLEGGPPDQADATRIATWGADAVLRMVFVDGCFHADPHPGNVLVLPGPRLGLVDFGMVGYLTDARRMEFLDLLFAVVSRDVEDAVTTLLGWANQDVDHELLAQDCAGFIDRYHGLPLGEMDTSALLMDLTELMRANNLFLPGDVAVLLKVFLTLDGLGRQLDPGFDMARHVEPFARHAYQREHSPLAVMRRGAREVGAILDSLPRDLRQLARHARRGRLRVDVDLERLESFGQKLDQSANRLTVGMVTAALIIGTSISLTVPGDHVIAGLPAFGLLGFASSIAAGVWLLWSILRSRRR